VPWCAVIHDDQTRAVGVDRRMGRSDHEEGH
jgi:hypothetical protein